VYVKIICGGNAGYYLHFRRAFYQMARPLHSGGGFSLQALVEVQSPSKPSDKKDLSAVRLF
jgi:hypothetical protein